MKKIITFIVLLFPMLLLGQGQRLGIYPASFNLTKSNSKASVSSFCSDGRARGIDPQTTGKYNYFQSPQNIEVKVNGKVFSEGINGLIASKDIIIKTKGESELIFALNPKSKYNQISVNIKEANVVADRKDDFGIADLWVDKMIDLGILPPNISSFKDAQPYIKKFQEDNGLISKSGLLTKETQHALDTYEKESLDLFVKLGYIDNDKINYQKVLSANKAFQEDWGMSLAYVKRIEYVLELINKYSSKSEGAFKCLVITKNTLNEYKVFDGLRKPITKTKDEVQLAGFLNSTSFEENENIYLLFSNFETEAKEEALISTVKLNLKENNRGISINKFVYDKMLFENNAFKLSEPLLIDNIKQVEYESKDYFSILVNHRETIYDSEIEALSTKKTILELLIGKINTAFSDFSTNLSMMKFLNSFKKDMKKNMQIQSDEEFVVLLKDQIGSIRIVKKVGEKDVIYEYELASK